MSDCPCFVAAGYAREDSAGTQENGRAIEPGRVVFKLGEPAENLPQ
jgi:hypothetical protein